jgi:hypothetical protein
MPTDKMMQFFAFAHLPPHLAGVSRDFHRLAETICATLPENPERTVALRKLLEAKDCAVRAVLYQPRPAESQIDGNRHEDKAMTGSAPHDGLMVDPTKPTE